MSTLSQVRKLARVKISQIDEGNTDFTNPELNGFINEGQRFLGVLVKKPTDHVDVAVELDTPAYSLPSDAILLATAYFGDVSASGDVRPLSILTEEALKEIAPSWLDESVSSQGRPQRIILLDRRTVLIHPRPNVAEAGKDSFLTTFISPLILLAMEMSLIYP